MFQQDAQHLGPAVKDSEMDRPVAIVTRHFDVFQFRAGFQDRLDLGAVFPLQGLVEPGDVYPFNGRFQ